MLPDPSDPGFYKLTDADIPALKAYLKNGGGVYINEALAKAAVEKGFVEGEHFHIIKPIPTYWPAPYRPTGQWR